MIREEGNTSGFHAPADAEVWPQWERRRIAQTRVVLIDDHFVVREGLGALLSLEPDIQVVGAAASIAEGITLTCSLEPDVVISDLTLPGCTECVAVRALRNACPDVRVLVLTVHDSLECIRAAFAAGAVGYVRKDALRDEMLFALRQAAAGGRATCRAVGDIVLRNWLHSSGQPERLPGVTLTALERKVLCQIALGVPTWRIAQELGRGVKMVEKYRVGLMRRLGLKSAAGVTRFALQANLVTHREVDRLLTAEPMRETSSGH
jgi:two-component system NarL family response regulator